MSEVQATTLPGVGIRYEFISKDGHRLAVVHHRRGRRELYVFDANEDEDLESVIDLDPEDGRILSELLGGSRVVEQLDELDHQIEGLALDWQTVGANSPYVNRTIGDARIRTRTAASVVAVLRGSTPFPAPGPSFRFEEGDTLVVVGTPEGLEAVERILEQG